MSSFELAYGKETLSFKLPSSVNVKEIEKWRAIRLQRICQKSLV